MSHLDHALNWVKKHDPTLVITEELPKEKKDEPKKEEKFFSNNSYCCGAFELID